MIQNTEGVSPNQERLIFAGSYLEDGNTLENDSIQIDSINHLIPRVSRWMPGFVKMLTGTLLPFEVKPTDLIKELRDQMVDKEVERGWEGNKK
jgi:ubiquitin C